MNEMIKNIFITLAVIGLLAMLTKNFGGVGMSRQISYSQFISDVKTGQLRRVEIEGNAITGELADGSMVTVYNPEDDNGALIGLLLEHDIEVVGQEPNRNSIWAHIFISWFPLLLLVGIWVYFMRQMQGGGSGRGALSFGKSRARMISEDQVRVTFKDVAGVEEAKEEVSELVEFLRDPARFQNLGGRIPRGVLMVGSPGTGKTLLAKAIAGEAQVPFFAISGSDFVEMFVGVGASRVRDMFEQAKQHSPCIIFIDEIDAVGRHRGAGLGGGHDEREQTLNQLLVEMDGFEGNEGVIVIAASNRPDVLDPALLRPGRFDRQVVVPLPDIRGREQILRVHMRKVVKSDDVRPVIIARGTPGFSGADLSNLVNEAALLAARANKKEVEMADFERAKDKVMMGAERRSMVMSEDEKKLTAYHEAGHAIVGRLVPAHDPVYKVTIIPRGRALGVTMFLPEEDRLSMSKEHLESKLSSLFGGRIAEEMIFGVDKVTTGASNDIEVATQIARNMVSKWGLSDVLGPLAYSDENDEVFLGHSVTRHKSISEKTAGDIDREIRLLIDRNYERASKLLHENESKLHCMAEALIKYETLDSGQIDDIMNNRPVRAPAGWNDDDSNSSGDDGMVYSDTEGKEHGNVASSGKAHPAKPV